MENKKPMRLSDMDIETRTKFLMRWIIVVLAGIFCFASIILISNIAYEANVINDVVKDHYFAVIGIAFATITSVFLVIVFNEAIGPIEIEAFGLKFRGAAGPLILWILCFLALVTAMAALKDGSP